MKAPTLADRVERVYQLALGRRWQRELFLRYLEIDFGDRSLDALALTDRIEKMIDDTGKPNEVMWAIHFNRIDAPPSILSLIDDLALLRLTPEEQWRLKGWQCRCGECRAIFMHTASDRPDPYRIWCARCIEFRGMCTEREFIEALDQESAIEILYERELNQYRPEEHASISVEIRKEADYLRNNAKEHTLMKLAAAGIDATSVSHIELERRIPTFMIPRWLR